jgi:hypothetical protein
MVNGDIYQVEYYNAIPRQIKKVFKRMYSINSLSIKPSLLREIEDIKDFDSFCCYTVASSVKQIATKK